MKRTKGLLLTLCVGLALTACAKENVAYNDGIPSSTVSEVVGSDTVTSQAISDITNKDTDQVDESEIETEKEEESAEDITIEEIQKMTSYVYQLDKFGSYRMTQKYTFNDYPDVEGPTSTYICAMDSQGYCEASGCVDNGDGTYQIFYQNDNPDDLYVYIASENGVERYEKDDEMQAFARESMLCSREDSRLVSVDKSEGTIEVVVDTYYAGSKEETYEIVLDEATSKILSASMHSDMANVTVYYEFDYDSDAVIDTTAKDRCIEYYGDVTMADALVFNSVDIDGNPVTEEMISGYKVVLLNLWSTSCGASLENNPNLQQLYEKYNSEGLLIIGVYSAMDDIEDVRDVVDRDNITYPIITSDINLAMYFQASLGSTPASFIFDGEGKLLESEPNIGYHSFKTWEEIILEYLQ